MGGSDDWLTFASRVSSIYPRLMQITHATETAELFQRIEVDDFDEYCVWHNHDLTIYCDAPQATFIDSVFPPHPESFYMAELIPQAYGSMKFLDVGVGSGILSVAAALKGWQVHGIDINTRALAMTKLNLSINNVQASLSESDLLDTAKNMEFDFCVANLPFEPTPPDSKNFLHSNGGPDGAELIHRFLADVKHHLGPNGLALVPAFSPLRDDGISVLENIVRSVSCTQLLALVNRLSAPIPLELLLDRYSKNEKRKALDYYKKVGLSYFVIEIGVIRNVATGGGFGGCWNHTVADYSWLYPLGFKKLTKPIQV